MLAATRQATDRAPVPGRMDVPVPRVLTFIEAATLTGQARMLLDFATRAGRTGSARIDLATFDRTRSGDPQGNRKPLAAAAWDAGLTIHVIGERRRFDPRVMRQMRDLADVVQPFLVETHNVKSHFLVRLTGLNRNHAWVAFHEGYTATNTRDRAYNQLNRWSLRAADVVVTMCRPFARLLERQGMRPERVRVLHNAIDVEAATPRSGETAEIRRTLSVQPGERIVLSVGRLSAEKGHRDLAAAFAQVRDKAARLVFVGDGPERGSLERQCGALGIAGRVTFVGQVPEPRGYYGVADVFALPSHSEGSPVALLEATAAGAPVVATAVGGVPEMVTDGETALLAPPRNPNALAHALQRALADRDLAARLGEAGRHAASTQFTPAHRRDALLAIYREALEMPRKGSGR